MPKNENYNNLLITLNIVITYVFGAYAQTKCLAIANQYLITSRKYLLLRLIANTIEM